MAVVMQNGLMIQQLQLMVAMRQKEIDKQEDRRRKEREEKEEKRIEEEKQNKLREEEVRTMSMWSDVTPNMKIPLKSNIGRLITTS